jgi:hypothetical protein
MGKVKDPTKPKKKKKVPVPYFRGISSFHPTVLAIDPGPTYSGFTVLNSAYEIIHCGKWTNEMLRTAIRKGMLSGNALVQEMLIPFGGSGKSVADTLVWLGAFEEAWATRNPLSRPPFKVLRITTRTYFIPKKKELEAIMLANPGYPKVADAQIRYELIRRYTTQYGMDIERHPNLKEDAWQALALAVFFVDKVNEYALKAKPLTEGLK